MSCFLRQTQLHSLSFSQIHNPLVFVKCWDFRCIPLHLASGRVLSSWDIAHLVGHLLSQHKASSFMFVFELQHSTRPGTAMCNCNPCIWNVKTGGLESSQPPHNHLWLYSEFKASMDNMRACLKTKQNTTHTHTHISEKNRRDVKTW